MANTQPSRPRKILAYCEDQQPYKKEGCQKSLIGLNDTSYIIEQNLPIARIYPLTAVRVISKQYNLPNCTNTRAEIRQNMKTYLHSRAREIPTSQDRLFTEILDVDTPADCEEETDFENDQAESSPFSMIYILKPDRDRYENHNDVYTRCKETMQTMIGLEQLFQDMTMKRLIYCDSFHHL